jgi:excinuclease UvrABC nuclease subunit
MGNEETIVAKGISGNQYKFWVYPWRHQLKAAGGVYMVLKVSETMLAPQYSVLYVGQTKDLNERFDEHHKQGCFNRSGKTHIGAILESAESKRLVIESDLIASYNPSCNG